MNLCIHIAKRPGVWGLHLDISTLGLMIVPLNFVPFASNVNRPDVWAAVRWYNVS